MTSEPVCFEIEYVFDRSPVIILARRVEAIDFVLTEESTLNGCPVQKHLEMPRALDAAGSPRLDIFAFTLRDGRDRVRFQPGQIVELRP